jgi:hypothetical protein
MLVGDLGRVLAIAAVVACATSQPRAPSLEPGPAPVAAPPVSEARVEETDEYIGCAYFPTVGAEQCFRTRNPGNGCANQPCRLVTIAYCFQGRGLELCYSDAASCLQLVSSTRRMGDTPTDCYVLGSTAGTRYAPEGAVAQQGQPTAAARPLSALPRSTYPPSAADSTRLLLFGGRDHKKFLGCLCNEFDTDSVFNEFGRYGSEFQSDSIFNSFGDYGSSFSDLSPCNSFANYPPVVVTGDGNFAGYLTVNEFKAGAITDEKVMSWLKQKVCKN